MLSVKVHGGSDTHGCKQQPRQPQPRRGRRHGGLLWGLQDEGEPPPPVAPQVPPPLHSGLCALLHRISVVFLKYLPPPGLTKPLPPILSPAVTANSPFSMSLALSLLACRVGRSTPTPKPLGKLHNTVPREHLTQRKAYRRCSLSAQSGPRQHNPSLLYPTREENDDDEAALNLFKRLHSQVSTIRTEPHKATFRV